MAIPGGQKGHLARGRWRKDAAPVLRLWLLDAVGGRRRREPSRGVSSRNRHAGSQKERGEAPEFGSGWWTVEASQVSSRRHVWRQNKD